MTWNYAGDGVDLNLWTSLDGETYTLAQTRRVTEKLVPSAFSQTFENLNQTVYRRRDGRLPRASSATATQGRPAPASAQTTRAGS